MGGAPEDRLGDGVRRVEHAAMHGLHRAAEAIVAPRSVLVAPVATLAVDVLVGGLGAAGGLLQRRLGLPDAAVLVRVLASETPLGRFAWFQPRSNSEVR